MLQVPIQERPDHEVYLVTLRQMVLVFQEKVGSYVVPPGSEQWGSPSQESIVFLMLPQMSASANPLTFGVGCS